MAAEVATGALAEANAVAQMATEDKATFLRDAVDVEARTLAEAGGEYSLEADGCLEKLGKFFFKNHQLFLCCHLFQMCVQLQDDSFKIWWAEKAERARGCCFGEITMDKMIVLELIRGVKDPELRERLLR